MGIFNNFEEHKKFIKFLLMSMAILVFPAVEIPISLYFIEARVNFATVIPHYLQLIINYFYVVQFSVLVFLIKVRFETLNESFR
jgi:hypothetical protein